MDGDRMWHNLFKELLRNEDLIKLNLQIKKMTLGTNEFVEEFVDLIPEGRKFINQVSNIIDMFYYHF